METTNPQVTVSLRRAFRYLFLLFDENAVISLTQPSDEEEIVDVMLEKLCSLFGIPYKATEGTLGPDTSGTGDMSYKNILNNSADDGKTSAKL